MINEEILRNIYKDLPINDRIGDELLLKTLLELVLEINFEYLDEKESSFERTSKGFDLRLYSLNNKKCPIFFEVLFNNIFDIQLNEGGEYLYMKSINDFSDLKKLRGAIEDILFYPIEESTVVVDGKIKSVKYLVHHQIDGKEILNDYSIIFGMSWFWEKKQLIKIEYEPWISCS